MSQYRSQVMRNRPPVVADRKTIAAVGKGFIIIGSAALAVGAAWVYFDPNLAASVASGSVAGAGLILVCSGARFLYKLHQSKKD